MSMQIPDSQRSLAAAGGDEGLLGGQQPSPSPTTAPVSQRMLRLERVAKQLATAGSTEQQQQQQEQRSVSSNNNKAFVCR